MKRVEFTYSPPHQNIHNSGDGSGDCMGWGHGHKSSLTSEKGIGNGIGQDKKLITEYEVKEYEHNSIRGTTEIKR